MTVQHLANTKGERFDDERLFPPRLGGRGEAEAKQAIDGSLEGVAGATDLVIQELGHIIVNGERGAHIMMVATGAS